MSALFIGHPNDHDLALFAGGELGPVARWRIEKHLQNCSRCGETVSEFFHLQSELGELAELPAVDWSAQARAITERARHESSSESQSASGGLLAGPWIFRAGLATAAMVCAVVVIDQFRPDAEIYEPQSSLTIEKTPGAQKQVADQVEPLAGAGARLGERHATAESAKAERPAEIAAVAEADKVEAKEEFRAAAEPTESLSKDARNQQIAESGASLAPDVEATAAPSGQKKTLALASQPVSLGPAAGFGDRKRDLAVAKSRAGRELANEAVQPDDATPPVAQSAGQLRAAAERESSERPTAESAFRDRTDQAAQALRRNKEQLGLQARSVEAAQEADVAGQVATAVSPDRRSEAYEETRPPQLAKTQFAILPASPEAQTEVGVSADGAISFRTVDAASGKIMITHVYEP